MSTQEIIDIYKRVEIQRDQFKERLKDAKANTLEKQLTNVFTKYFDMLQNPKIPVAMIDEAKRDMTKTLSIIVMDSDHDVIMALTNNLIEKKYREKIKNDS